MPQFFFDILQFFLLTTESRASGKTGRFGAASVMMGRSSSCEKQSENCSRGPCPNRPLVPFQTKRLFAFLFLCLVLNDSGLWCHKIIRMLKNAVLIQSLMLFSDPSLKIHITKSQTVQASFSDRATLELGAFPFLLPPSMKRVSSSMLLSCKCAFGSTQLS